MCLDSYVDIKVVNMFTFEKFMAVSWGEGRGKNIYMVKKMEENI